MKAIRRATFGWPEAIQGNFEDGWGNANGAGRLSDYNWAGYNPSPTQGGEGTGDGWGAGALYGVRHGGDMSGNYFLLMADSEGRRTERVFRCAGCVGGYECSIHGRRL